MEKREREPGRKQARGGRREGGKRESQAGRNREKLRKNSQHFVIFRTTNGAKRRKPLREKAGSGSKTSGKGEKKIREAEAQINLSLPPPLSLWPKEIARKKSALVRLPIKPDGLFSMFGVDNLRFLKRCFPGPSCDQCVDGRGTQRMISVNICSKALLSPQ